MTSNDTLQYPDHYPPTDRRQRFFIGVRWLGPDLSFFKTLSALQKSRTHEQMARWGGGNRQQVATLIGKILARHLRWPSAYFLPGDNFGVIAGGPCFNSIDGDIDIADAIGEIEEQLGVAMPRSFWQESGTSTLGDVVDQLQSRGGV